MLLHLGKSCAIIHFTTYGGIAQSVEHLLHMQGVTGSSPVVSTIFSKFNIRRHSSVG